MLHPLAEQVPMEHNENESLDNVECFPGLEPTKLGEKARVVVLDTGWAGCHLMKGLNTKLYDVVCISPRNRMVFTPLLASTYVGTLEFRSLVEPVSRVPLALSESPNSYFLLAKCLNVDTNYHEVYCKASGEKSKSIPHPNWSFKVAYDKLIIGARADPLTFGIQGVNEHAIFLREFHHAQEIRRKILLNLMFSDVPGIIEDEKTHLLHYVVVGGGPTGVEFSGELSDFLSSLIEKFSFCILSLCIQRRGKVIGSYELDVLENL